MNVTTNFSCGERIKELRIERSLSQEKLALNAGITPAYLGLLERGKRNATVVIIEKLCDALHVSLADFFSVADKFTPVQNEVGMQIMYQISDLSVDEQEAILQIVKSVLLFKKKTEYND